MICLNFDIVLKNSFSGIEIEYGIIKGDSTILFIKTGHYGSIYGYNNKYIEIAKNINSKYGSTVICSSNPFNGINPLDDAMKVIDDYCSDMNFEDYQIYYVGNSNGGIIGARWGYLYPKIKKLLLLNAPLMMNLHHTKDGLSRFTGEKNILVYGDKDPSFRYVELLNNINSRLEYHIASNQDHHFSNGDNPINDFIENYLY